MSFQITIETQAAEAQLQKMIDTLKVVPVAKELTAWQAEDMRRRYPETEEINPVTAMTVIYPRSRGPKRMKPRVPGKPVLRRGKATRIAKPSSNRPILRPELVDKLQERMNAMLVREVKW
jgi:hypothetical protein